MVAHRCRSTPDDVEALREDVSRQVFFAGEATSSEFPSFVHGAYLSGVDAARDVVAALKPTRRDVDTLIAAADGTLAAAECSLCHHRQSDALLGPMRGIFLDEAQNEKYVVHELCVNACPEVSRNPKGEW
jgi:cytochrome c553